VELHIHTRNAINMIISEPGKQIDAAVASILIGAMVVVGFVALIFVTLGEGSHGPDAVMWRAAVGLILVGCLIAGLINAIRVIAQIRRHRLEAERITMASWLGLPASADAGGSFSPRDAATD
jgi:drug/metabolite transporter (DMT)-like permease